MRDHFLVRSGVSKGFTLIELLIVVAIIAILAAIAVPNFLEAQVRAKTSRAKSDMRSVATAIESYRVDHNEYPEGTDNPNRYPENIQTLLGPLATGFYSFCTRETGGLVMGRDFFGLTTPISYITQVPLDPFASTFGIIPYAYRNAKATKDGWILTSIGPDGDLLNEHGYGTTNTNPLSTYRDFTDGRDPARIADINERYYINIIEGDGNLTQAEREGLVGWLDDLSYDPTNGSVSDGDLYRAMGTPR